MVLSDVDEPRLHQTAHEIGASSHVVDVVDPKAVQTLVDYMVFEHGRIDYMFNSAGVGIVSEVIVMKLDDWYRHYKATFAGVL